jgi:hypothetical protein
MPRYGFNFLWMYTTKRPTIQPPDEKALDFMADLGLNFVRIPTDYRFWTQDQDYMHPDESVFEHLDRYLDACRVRGIQMSLNLHRAPGYCVANDDLEPHNLWADSEAQDGFVFQWETFARRYRGVPNDALSFDLLNEPPWEGGRYGMTREKNEAVMRRAVGKIRAIDPDREIVINGIGCGKLAIPELADLGVVHGARGYTPMSVSHYEAPWADSREGDVPPPTYPGAPSVGSDRHFLEEGGWDREILRDSYRPWLDVAQKGVAIHVGEFGCYNRTPNDVALRWLGDLFDLYREWGWGYALWNFKGPFGIIDHGREGARFENYKGYRVDRDLLDLFLNGRLIFHATDGQTRPPHSAGRQRSVPA